MNCGSCHADGGSQSDLPLRLRLESDRLGRVEDTATFATAVGRNAEDELDGRRTYLSPGDPDNSLLVHRMGSRGNDAMMPPTGSEVVDDDGLAAVRAFVDRRRHPRRPGALRRWTPLSLQSRRVSQPQKPKVIPPPAKLPILGPLVVVDGDCAYFGGPEGASNRLGDGLGDGPGDRLGSAEAPRPSKTAFALPGKLKQRDYGAAMSLGMRRSGTLVYRPICAGCRRCQPFRVDVERFEMSRSQRRVWKRCDGLFTVDVVRPVLDREHLLLYARYQEDQHDKDGQQADEESYARFLVDTVADTWELCWRDASGKLVAAGIVDVVEDGVSTVYFYWDPDLRDLSLGVFSALWEIDLCRRWKKRYYYLGYLVRGSRTMSYKSQFGGGEVWDGAAWIPVPGRDLAEPAVEETLARAEAAAAAADRVSFPLEGE